MTPLIAFSIGFAVRHAAGKIANWLARRALRDEKAAKRKWSVVNDGRTVRQYCDGVEVHRRDTHYN